MNMKEWIANLPKAELHCHLDGSMTLDAVRNAAKQAKIELPDNNEELLLRLQASEDCGNLMEYLECFQIPLDVLQTKEALRYTTYSLLREAAKDHLIYMEMRFAPLSCVRKGLTVSDTIEAVLQGMQEGEEAFGIKSGLILCGMRHTPQEENIEMLREAKKYIGKGVVAADLAGGEEAFPPTLHETFFKEAKEMGYHLTIHAGECHSAQNVIDSIAMGAERIGHGIAIEENEEVMEQVAKAGVCLELCPSSNLQTKAVKNLSDYPLKKFMEHGICVTLSTDNRMVTGTSVSQEYERVQEALGLEIEELLLITKNAINHAFLSEDEKAELLQKVEHYEKETV